MMSTSKYSTWRVPQLKEELKKRNGSVKGKKADLIERLDMYDQNFNFGQAVEDPDGNTDPVMNLPPIESYKDINSKTMLPPINKTLIRQYLDYTTNKIDTAFQLYESRYLLVARSSHYIKNFYIKGFCKKTMKNLQYEVDVKINEDGNPEEAHCECPAGSGVATTCKHVAVLLLGIENMVQQKGMLLSEVCTQKLQQWNCPATRYTGSPMKAHKIPRKRSPKRILFA